MSGSPEQIGKTVAVVPAFNAAETVTDVLRGFPPLVSLIIVVDDGSMDETAEVVRRCAVEDNRIILLSHAENRGISAAMTTGFARALIADAEYIFKLDSDGRMRPDDLPRLLYPLATGRADYAKGNRFRDFHALRAMPTFRIVGNVLLSFAAKAATGYWNIFDPTNGFIAVRSEVLRQVRLGKLQGYYIFETAMLAELYLLGAVVEDVPMRAHYGKESSHLSITRAGATYPWRLLSMFARRVFLRYFVMDFTMASLFILTGLPMVFGGTVHGLINWWHYSHLGSAAPTGTVILPALLVILGIQFVLSAIHEDLRSVPSKPISGGRLSPVHPAAGNGALLHELNDD